jgi:hypothetical protein
VDVQAEGGAFGDGLRTDGVDGDGEEEPAFEFVADGAGGVMER